MSLALPTSGDQFLWDVETTLPLQPANRTLSAWRVSVLSLGFLVSVAAAAGSWFFFWPATRVQTWIVADGSGPAGRTALAEAAMRIAQTPNGSATLGAHGDTLVITAVDQDPAIAWRRVRSEADTLLNLSVRPESAPPPPGALEQPAVERTPLHADRDRLLAVAQATDARAATVSASLTSLARDIASNARPPADRSAGRETLEKGAAAMADLQIQRIQLLTRYQDDYPAVVALDTQIRSLRSLLQDEAHRLDALSRIPPADTVDPVLAAERERLRTELSQLNDRRTAIATELSTTAHAPIAAAPSAAPSVRLATATPAPVLIEAATTITSGSDNRWILVPAAAAIGLLISLLAWFKPQRQPGTLTAEHMLQRLEAAMLPPAVRTALTSDGYASFDRNDTGMMLTSPPERATGQR